MSKGPLDGLLKVYNKCVKEADKKGFADIYKKATDVLFERIKKETELDLHFEDVAFGDGYFIFGYGTNSVVHFHIKEAPGWLFGIWWSPVETEETKNKKRKEYITDQVYCELFAQYEEEIDKFKPTASTFCSSFRLHFDENYYDGFINGCADIRFIVKEPYLAFYREMHCVDFNHEYVSRETAKRYWNRHWKEKAKDKANDKLNAQTMFNTVKHIIDPIVKGGDAFILDEGSNVNPRYQIFIRNVNLSDGKPLVEEEGFYGLFDFDYPDRKANRKGMC